MNRWTILLFFCSCALMSSALGQSVEFDFVEPDLDTLYAITRSALAPNGKIINTNSAIQVFADRKNTSLGTIENAVVAFSEKKESEGDFSKVDMALGYLAGSSETNSLPYLRNYILNPVHENFRNQAIYAYMRKMPSDWNSLLVSLINRGQLNELERKSIYRTVRTLCYASVVENPVASESYRKPLIEFLESISTLERDFKHRTTIDMFLCDYLEGWKYSEKRQEVIMSWTTSETVTRNAQHWSDLLTEIRKDIQEGNTEWETVPGRPRRPTIPRNQDGSIAIPNIATNQCLDENLVEACDVEHVNKDDAVSERKGNFPSMHPLAVSAIAIALLGLAGFLLERHRRRG